MADSLRILHVTRNLPPLVGGMERLNWHIADELSRHAEVRVVGPRGAAAHKPEAVEVAEVPLRPLWRFLLASAWRSIREARRFRPDVVLAGSGLTAPAAWLAARMVGGHAVAYVHGLDVAVRHPIYRAIWHPLLRRMGVVIANSSATAVLVRGLGVEELRIRIVHPGVGLPSAPQSSGALHDFRDRHGLGDGRLLLSIGRLTTRKGLREFVQQALPAIVQQVPDAMLVVIGDAPAASLMAGVQTRDSIQAAANAAGVGRHLHFLGVITDPKELACAFECADVHVFPVREIPGDPEGFGMVAIEAAAHGVPTVAFATGGVIDAVAEGQSGNVVPPGDYAAFAGEVASVLSKEHAMEAECRAFASQFAWPLFGQKLHAEMIALAGVAGESSSGNG